RFSDGLGSPTCSLCALGKYAATADVTTACTDCEVGKYAKTGQDRCLACESGLTTLQKGSADCQRCGEGAHTAFVRPSTHVQVPTCLRGKSNVCAVGPILGIIWTARIVIVRRISSRFFPASFRSCPLRSIRRLKHVILC